MPIDEFNQRGPNGKHQCSVFDPMGPSVAQMLDDNPNILDDVEFGSDRDCPPPPPPPAETRPAPLTLAQRKTILKQVLQGPEYLHSIGIAHGDLNPGNVLLCVPPLSPGDVQKIMKSSEHGRSALVRRLDGKQDLRAPRRLYIEQPLRSYLDLNPLLLAKISDFGAAFSFSNPPSPKGCTIPTALRPPELLLKDPISHKIDIWTFGCLVHEVLTGQQLFQVSRLWNTSQEPADDNHILQMIDALGFPPPEIFERWHRRLRYFDENLQLIRSDVGPSEIAKCEPLWGPTLKEAFAQAKPDAMDDGEAAQVTKLMRKILQYDSSQRPSATEIMEDEWFPYIE